MKIKLRLAAPSDAARLLEIYRPYVENTTVSLEYDVPTVEEFKRRIVDFSAEFPYIVCELDGAVIGYAYAHRYKARYGYRFAAETTVYLDGSCRGMGIGKRLYGAVFDLLTVMGYKNLYAIVTGENRVSMDFHRAMGFSEVGREHLNGFKLGRWVDVVLFEKHVGEHEDTSDPETMNTSPKSIGEISDILPSVLEKFEQQ